MLGALVGALSLVGGCATAPAEPSDSTASEETAAVADCSLEGKEIRFVSMLREHPVIQTWAAGAETRSEELGANYEALISQGDNPQEAITLAQQALASGIDGMVVIAFDPQWYPLIKEAQDAEVPVAITHFATEQADAPGTVVNIATNVADYGVLAAQAIGEELGGVGTVAVTQGAFNATEDLAASSFTEEMNRSFPDIVVLPPQLEAYDLPQAIATNSAILLGNPDVNAAFGTTGGSPSSWAGAAADTGRDITIIGMDYTRPNLELVKDGRVFGLVAQPLFEANYAAVDALQTVICGGEVEYRQSPPAPIITSENVQEYFDLLDRIGL